MDDVPPEIVAEAIRLRPMRDDDLPGIVTQLANPDVSQWLAAVPQRFGMQDAAALKEHAEAPGEHLRIIEVDGTQAGCLCLGAGLWYWLEPSFHGRGVMSSALTEALKAWFRGPARPIWAASRLDNTPSGALLARLGFSRAPTVRRMFFHGAGRSLPCHDYVMTPETWVLLHPPVSPLGPLTRRPALPRDAAMLAAMLPSRHPIWPAPEALLQFMERNRVRRPGVGLFKLEDDNSACIAFALLGEASPAQIVFASPEDAEKYGGTLSNQLADVDAR